jgi:sec-independent protein translocase protein TatA
MALVIFALFGYKKLPDAARSLGRSMRVFKAETRGLKEDDVRGKAEARAAHGPLGDTVAADTAADVSTPIRAESTVVEEQPAKQRAAGA